MAKKPPKWQMCRKHVSTIKCWNVLAGIKFMRIIAAKTVSKLFFIL